MLSTHSLVILHDGNDSDLCHKLVSHLHNLQPWHPGLLAAGKDRAVQRDRVAAAPLVILLISAELLAHPEYSPLLTLAMSRRDSGQCLLLPVRARPVDATDHRLNDLAFVALGPGDRYDSKHALRTAKNLDAALTCVATEARRLWALVSSRAAAASPSFQPGADAQLTILLTPVAEGLRVEYSLPSLGVFRSTVATAEAFAAARAGGEALFRLLFPGDAWEVVLTTATGAPVPSPARCALRVRILCAEPSLAELPFHRIAWQGASLSLWTFECTRSEHAAPPTELRTPCRISACVPSAPHRDALREVLRRIAPHQADETHLHLCHPLASVPPGAVLYVHGAATPAGVAALAALPEETRLIYLNGPGWAGAAHHAAARVPLVLWGDGTEATALAFFDACLVRQHEPAKALRELANLGYAPPVLYTGSETFTVRAVIAQTRAPMAHLRVNRDAQRALVDKHVTELLASRTRRVEALVAYAGPQNHLERFPTQALDFLDRHLVRHRLKTLRLPAKRGPLLRQTLPQELREQLEAAPGETTPDLLRRHAGPGTRLLWLDWGCQPDGGLKAEDLLCLLQFSEAELCRDCPSDLRIVSYLGWELSKQRHDGLVKFMDKWEQKLFHDRFRCTLLPVLDSVRPKDLLNFLSDPANSTCLPSQVADAARLIHEAARQTGTGYPPKQNGSMQHGPERRRPTPLAMTRPS